MTHIDHCLNEMEAELDALLAADEHVRALAQLDAREARGEALEVVDPRLLRRHLEQAIARNRHTQAKARLAELRRTLAGEAVAASADVPLVLASAVAEPVVGVPGRSGGEVVRLDVARPRRGARRSVAGIAMARLGATLFAIAAGAMLTLGPRQAHDMVAEASSHAGARVLGMACTVVTCQVEAAAR